MSDAKTVGDKQIMQNTKVEAQPSSGRVRFSTTLPSGRKVESEWIKESDKTKGVLQWCEGVRAQIVADQEEQLAQTKRRLREERDSAAARIVGPDSSPISHFGTSPTMASVPLTGSSTPAAAVSLSDPRAFIEAQVTAAEARLQRWSYEAQRAQQELTLATNDLRQWQAIRASLLPQSSPVAIPTATSGGQSGGLASGLGARAGTGATGPSIESIDFSDIDEEGQQ